MLEPSGDGTGWRSPCPRVTRPGVAPTRLRRRVAVAFVLAVGVATGVLAVGSYVVVRNARLDDSATRAVRQTVVNLRYATTQPNVQALFDGLRARGQSSAGGGVDAGCATADVRSHRRRPDPGGAAPAGGPGEARP